MRDYARGRKFCSAGEKGRGYLVATLFQCLKHVESLPIGRIFDFEVVPASAEDYILRGKVDVVCDIWSGGVERGRVEGNRILI